MKGLGGAGPTHPDHALSSLYQTLQPTHQCINHYILLLKSLFSRMSGLTVLRILCMFVLLVLRCHCSGPLPHLQINEIDKYCYLLYILSRRCMHWCARQYIACCSENQHDSGFHVMARFQPRDVFVSYVSWTVMCGAKITPAVLSHLLLNWCAFTAVFHSVTLGPFQCA